MPVSERRSAATVIGRSTRAGSPAGTRTAQGPGPALGQPHPDPPGVLDRVISRLADGPVLGAGMLGAIRSKRPAICSFPVLQPRRRGGFLREPGERRSAHGGMGLLGACLIDRAHQLARG
jgi:hypothetical protein